MDIILPLLTLVISPFAGYPILGVVFAGIFIAGGISKNYGFKSRLALLIIAVLWLLFSYSNYYWLNWVSSTGDRAIRIDLVIYSLPMLIFTIIGVFLMIKGRIKNGT